MLDSTLYTKSKDMLRIKDFERGFCYICTDKRLLLYLGRLANGVYVFYFITYLPIVKCKNDKCKCKILHTGTLHPFILDTVDSVMGNLVDEDCVVELDKPPRVLSVYPDIDLRDKVNRWWTRSGVFGGIECVKPLYDTYDERFMIEKKDGTIIEEERIEFVPENNIERLHVYETIDSDLYLYLGNSNDGKLLWLKLERYNTLIESPISTFYDNIYRDNSVFETDNVPEVVESKKFACVPEILDLNDLNGSTKYLLTKTLGLWRGYFTKY